MRETQYSQSENITFIGAGIATGFALLQLTDELKLRDGKKALKVRVVDKFPEFFSGVPYGKRSSNTVLLINSLENFIPEPQRALFIEWLKTHKQDLIKEFLSFGGIKSKKWISENQRDIDSNSWNQLYIPRFFFGKYISEKVKIALSNCEEAGLISLTYSIDEVVDIENLASGFEVRMNKEAAFHSDIIVVSLGSLPTRRIFSDELIEKQKDYVIFNDIYSPSLNSNFQEIKSFLRNRVDKQTHVLIIGANASGLETLYKFSDEKEIDELVSSYTVISSHGIMPDSEVDPVGQKKFTPDNLKKLRNENHITANQIASAAYDDLQNAHNIKLGAASTVDLISLEIGFLLSKLTPEEAELFACYHGNNIGRLQRCAGSHYTSVVKELKEKQRLTHIAGRYSKLIPTIENEGKFLKLEYVDTKSKKVMELPKKLHLVINCMGSTDLVSPDTPILLKNLIEKKLVQPNPSNIGFNVNANFEASDDFYIAGPLLAGNVIDKKPLWHLEHCGRIIWTSTLLIKNLFGRYNESELN